MSKSRWWKTPPIELGWPWEWPPYRKGFSSFYRRVLWFPPRIQGTLGGRDHAMQRQGLWNGRSQILGVREMLLMKKIQFTIGWDAFKRHGSKFYLVNSGDTVYVTMCQLVDAILSIHSSQKWIQTIFGFSHHPLSSRWHSFLDPSENCEDPFCQNSGMICKS